MVAEGDLHAEDLGNEEEVVADGIGEKRRRAAVVGRVHPGGDAFGLKGADLGEKVWDGARRVVGAGDADDVGRAAGDEFGEHELGRARGRTAFTAAARDVDVLVDETRGHDGTTGVDRLEAGDGKALKALLHGDDPAACDEDVATAELFGGEDFGVLDEDGTGHAFSFGPARGQK